jgi:hypothetical protein
MPKFYHQEEYIMSPLISYMIGTDVLVHRNTPHEDMVDKECGISNMSKPDRAQVLDAIGYLIGDLRNLARLIVQIDGGSMEDVDSRTTEAERDSAPDDKDLQDRLNYVKRELDTQFWKE